MLLQLALIFKPWVLEKLCSRCTLCNSLGKSELEEADGLLADGLEIRFIVVDICVDDHAFNLLLSLAWVRVPARQQHVGDHADTPNIDLLVVSRLHLLILANPYDLRCHVEWTAQNEVEALLRIKEAREAKISNLNTQVIDVLRLEEDVLWLEIAMCDVLAVHVVDSEQDLVHNHSCF